MAMIKSGILDISSAVSSGAPRRGALTMPTERVIASGPGSQA